MAGDDGAFAKRLVGMSHQLFLLIQSCSSVVQDNLKAVFLGLGRLERWACIKGFQTVTLSIMYQ